MQISGIGGKFRSIHSCAQFLGVHQHTLQQTKIVLLSGTLDQNMPKHALF